MFFLFDNYFFMLGTFKPESNLIKKCLSVISFSDNILKDFLLLYSIWKIELLSHAGFNDIFLFFFVRSIYYRHSNFVLLLNLLRENFNIIFLLELCKIPLQLKYIHIFYI